MKTAIKTVIVLLASLLLADRFAAWAYASTWLTSLTDSPFGQHAFLALVRAFNLVGPEQEEDLLLTLVLGGSFVLALIVVGLVARFVVGPLYRSVKQRGHP